MKQKLTDIKKDGFKVPKDYFSEFDDRLSEKIKADQFIPNQEGFKVPDNYFKTFQQRLDSKIQRQETKVISLHEFRKWALPAAGIAALFIIGLFVFKNNPQNGTSGFETLAISEIDTYIEEGYFTPNSYDIVETFNDVPLDNVLFAESIDENEIIDYLSNTNMDPYYDESSDNEQ
ncbi:hypothetical protein OOZ15_00740 [Galbibacter sp. EGI 63066]|uniref:hypothetical protein n=1 Tax=Galbibacter sp. EGI 63066 TaxID=2993559 RepID=UPI002248E1D3|nr:hypothetical protein [Galbibacter sp. EGI 63066]MCX2678455.1 hypothetical protein [Galbibacter sp. EGI 63066]